MNNHTNLHLPDPHEDNTKRRRVELEPPPSSGTIETSLSQQWQRTIERVVLSIVSVRFMIVSSFDTEPATISEATGFIIDSCIGLVLTNRHVVGAGPFVGTIVCHDHEEVEATAIYRDPVHDFGLLKFDPAKIKYMPVQAIPLRPDLAKVGLDIRVCGNDAGEKLSILAGSISRTNRNAPDYGELMYNDFNTFYIQAASSSSGGSSGSPVLDIHGNAVALQAGGAVNSATNYFLPLDGIVRTLTMIRSSLNAPNVPRGSIQVRWLHQAYDEVRRLGLRQSTEAKVRAIAPDEIGLLVADNVLPKTSPAFGMIEEGDVLVRLNGGVVTTFGSVESILDDSIGKTVTIEVERGGKPLIFSVKVEDLHGLTPRSVLEVGGAMFNDLSYQLARYYGVPVEGVYVAEAGGVVRFIASSHRSIYKIFQFNKNEFHQFRFAGVTSGIIVQSIDSQLVKNIDDMIRIIKSIPDHDRISVTYYAIRDAYSKHVITVSMDKTWLPFRLATRNDSTGLWDYTNLNVNPVPERPLSVQTVVIPEYSLPDRIALLMRSLVKITTFLPIVMDGFPKSRRVGYGLVIDSGLGLVLSSRSHVPYDLADVTVTFWDSAELPAKVIFVHPVMNFSVVQYPAQYLCGPIVSAALEKNPQFVKPGQRVDFLGITDGQRPVHVTTTVTDVTHMAIPCSGEPRSRAINFEGITLDSPAASTCFNGVLADHDSGKIVGVWLNYLGALNDSTGQETEYAMGFSLCDFVSDLHRVVERVQQLQSSDTCVDYPISDLGLYCLGLELGQISLVKARTMGVSEDWLKRIQARKGWHVLIVKRVESGSESDPLFEELDLVLAINGQPLYSVRDFNSLTSHNKPVLVDILRKKNMMQITVTPTPLDQGTSRCVLFCGALIQPPHLAVRQQCRRLPSGCYISDRQEGSPAVMYGLSPTMFIIQINDRPTPNLDTLLDAVDDIVDRSYVRVKLVSFDSVPVVISVKMCLHYFPTVELKRQSGSQKGWTRLKRESRQ